MRLLLDCHISKSTVRALLKRASSLKIEHLADWRNGAFLMASDEQILTACHEERRIFLTFDQKTIPDLLRRWAAEERPHSGILFADENSIPPNQPGVLAAAIAAFAEKIGDQDWTNLVRFLRPPSEKHRQT